jgi:parallel beta-helix repeat protein
MSLLSVSVAAFGTPHAPIAIDGDADFAAQALAEGWAGDGSSGNPYIIADYDIAVPFIDPGWGDAISIKNTTSYFDINSCCLSLGFSFAGTGLRLDNVTNGVLNGVTSQYNGNGMMIMHCSNIVINGGAWDPYVGLPDTSLNAAKSIYIWDSTDCTINGIATWYSAYGLYAASCTNLVINGGDWSYNLDGIYLGSCNGVTISSSATIQGNSWNGLDMRSCTNVQVSDISVMYNSYHGIFVSRGSDIRLTGSAGTPSSLYVSSNSFSGLYASSVTDLTVESGTFDSNQRSGISLMSCTNPRVMNSSSTCNYNYYNGIMIEGSHNVYLLNDNANGNYVSSGIYLKSSENVMVESCDASGNDNNGIYMALSKNITLSNSFFDGSIYTYGIYGTSCTNVAILDCSAYGNSQSGLVLIGCTAPTVIDGLYADENGLNGIDLRSCPSALIIDCSATENGWNGIFIKGCNNLEINGVVADSNGYTGIYVGTSANLLVTNGCTANGNIRDGLYVGICGTPTIEDLTATGNGWWGIRCLGDTNVTVTGSTLNTNGFGNMYWPNTKPYAIFSLARIEAISPATTFDASASYDYDGTIVSYDWNFGDGTVVSVGTPITTHQYADMANRLVTLSVVDNGAKRSDVVSKDVSIQTSLCAKIKMPDAAIVGEDVTLDAGASFTFIGARSIVAYEWDFGDSSPLEDGATTMHAWSVADTYTVGLRVQDDAGAWSPVITNKIRITDAAVVGYSVGLSRHSIMPGEPVLLTITAVDGAGNKVATCTDDVDVTVNNTSGWSGLPTTVTLVGGEISFSVSCSNVASYTITATCSTDPLITGSELVTVANETIEIRVYDFGGLALGSYDDTIAYPNNTASYWNPMWRGKWGDCPFRYETPMALNLYSTGNNLASNIDTTYRVNVEARNMSSINMASPTFFPRMNAGTGGNMSFSWDYHYLNRTEFWFWNLGNEYPMPSKEYGYYLNLGYYNPYQHINMNTMTWSADDQANLLKTVPFCLYNQADSAYDGWETMMDINVTMDRDAAWQMIGLPLSESDIMLWWDRYAPGCSDGNDSVRSYWENTFMVNEGGSPTVAGRLDIGSCDDGYTWIEGFWNSYYRIYENVNGTVSLHIWRVGYGEDTLLAKWLYWGGVSNGWNYPNGTPGGILPFEQYYDDFYMVGNMNAATGNIALDTGVIYGFRAQKSADPLVPDGTAVWRWEHTRIDYAGAAGGLQNRSEMDLWVDNGRTFEVWDPAGIAWGITIAADQTPNILYLRQGQSLILEEPRSYVSGILGGPLVGDTATTDRQLSGYNNWILIQEKWGMATIHPIGCPDGTYTMDPETGDVDIVGPFVPIISYYSDLPWLWDQSAPLIEYWIQ